jgi:hypothetical protein
VGDSKGSGKEETINNRGKMPDIKRDNIRSENATNVSTFE